MPIQFSVEEKQIQAAGKIAKQYEDGKQIRKNLLKRLRGVAAPTANEIKSNLMAMGGGQYSEAPSLRGEVAKNLKVESRLSGRMTGVRVKIKRTESARDFANAPKRINSRSGWRRRIYGRDQWVQQVGQPGFFDDTTRDRREEAQKEVISAVNDVLNELSERVDRAR